MTNKELTAIAQYLTEIMASDEGVAMFRRFTQDDWERELSKELGWYYPRSPNHLAILGDK